jgi:hypothetical protein
MKKLKELTKEEYLKINKAGLLNVIYPKATGSFDDDCGIKKGFKVGDWVICLRNPVIPERIVGFHYNEHMKIEDREEQYCYQQDYRLATPEEIEEHLITEAKKRGYKKGVIVKSAAPNSLNSATLVGDPEFKSFKQCRFNDDSLKTTHNSISFKIRDSKPIESYSMNIYSDEYGWAEIIEEPKLKIGEYNVEKVDGGVKIGCQPVNTTIITALKNLKRVCAEHNCSVYIFEHSVILNTKHHQHTIPINDILKLAQQ